MTRSCRIVMNDKPGNTVIDSSLSSTPVAERIRISFFGRRNAGKSSLVNAITGQPVAIVSEVKGTTTDPVQKTMELLPLGPVVITDTPGLDDEGELGALRVERTLAVLERTDLAVVVVAATEADSAEVLEQYAKLAAQLRERKIPFVVALNQHDLVPADAEFAALAKLATPAAVLPVSAATGEGVGALFAALIKLAPEETRARLVGDMLRPGDLVVLVTPIDTAAPKGRLILPQQQVLRDILDSHAVALVTQVPELRGVMERFAGQVSLVVTDSQAFAQVAAIVPASVRLTSFSILFARYKGDLRALMEGAAAVERLRDGDRVLIAEGCTHHRQEDDIGTVKIPRWLRERTGKELVFEHTRGIDYRKDLSSYALVVHCGGCMLNRREMMWRIAQAQKAGVPIVNYGVLIAYLKGILDRVKI